MGFAGQNEHKEYLMRTGCENRWFWAKELRILKSWPIEPKASTSSSETKTPNLKVQPVKELSQLVEQH